MIDPREFGPRAHEYGDIYQRLVSITVGFEERINGVDVFRSGPHEFEIDDETTSAAGACELIIEAHYSQECRGLGDSWTGGFAKNH